MGHRGFVLCDRSRVKRLSHSMAVTTRSDNRVDSQTVTGEVLDVVRAGHRTTNRERRDSASLSDASR